ncbi:septum formation initiator family protein [Microbacterium sp. STN6]|uniref:FtsB family cell division protein n=1 Tax=Microbacterium sp. STN6 TaxID=2995588 RepID=UPI002260FAB9|nr:septum formation initiator family protein [Microbacterium sp. STN6]MCX7521841.1 septum formation initiator family protein [Microbacterium sp. STN6]
MRRAALARAERSTAEPERKIEVMPVRRPAESRAPTTRRVPVAMQPKQSAAGGWLRGIRFSGFSLLMMALVILAVVILAPTLHLYITQQQKIDDLRAQVHAEQNRLDDARVQRARWSDPSYVRSQVRDRLYYVMPGETNYLIIDDRTAAEKRAHEAPVSKKIQTTKTDWLQALLASTVTAGTTDAPPAHGAAAGSGQAAPTSTPVATDPATVATDPPKG